MAGVPSTSTSTRRRGPQRRNLADVRAGEYEGLADKLADPAWRPDYGPAAFVPRSGATVIGARPSSSPTTSTSTPPTNGSPPGSPPISVRRAASASTPAGKPVRDADGAEIWDKGLLRGIKAVGWTIPEYGCAQVSINVTDLEATLLHLVFDTCVERATVHGLRVTGSELVGMVPRDVLLAAGRHYLAGWAARPACPRPPSSTSRPAPSACPRSRPSTRRSGSSSTASPHPHRSRRCP